MILNCEQCGTKYNPEGSYHGSCPLCRIVKRKIRQEDRDWVDNKNTIGEFRRDQIRKQQKQVNSFRQNEVIRWERAHKKDSYETIA
jgi:hypothetical protein